MVDHRAAGRFLGVLAVAVLAVGCAAAGGPTSAPATLGPAVAPSNEVATPRPAPVPSRSPLPTLPTEMLGTWTGDETEITTQISNGSLTWKSTYTITGCVLRPEPWKPLTEAETCGTWDGHTVNEYTGEAVNCRAYLSWGGTTDATHEIIMEIYETRPSGTCVTAARALLTLDPSTGTLDLKCYTEGALDCLATLSRAETSPPPD